MSLAARRTTGDRALRIDERTGVSERVEFVGPPGGQIFSVAYMPPVEIRGRVLISASLLADRVRTYRAEVELARRLAAEGFMVQRYDYRGFGHADGVSGDATFDTLLADLDMACSVHLGNVSHLPLVHIGIRFGALVAAEGVRRFGGDIVFWDPAPTARGYFREAFRAHLVGRLGRHIDGVTPEQQLAAEGWTEVMGYSVSRPLVESVGAVEIDKILAGAGPRILWIGFGEALGKKQQGLVQGWKARHLEVEVATVPLADSTWFIGARPIVGDEVIERTVTWVRTRASR